MKLKLTKTIPILGDFRVKKYFAWFPTVVKNELIWLSFYYVNEKFVYEYRGIYESENHWRFISFISKTEYDFYVNKQNLLNQSK